tara:strand:+ start:1001 stop:1450 length:450 start_codon:yes stop_codon:yes gene_type:complete
MKLNNLISLKRKKLRVGRGIGSGKGKTSGRGVKGQKSRSGVAIKSFEGGQMPLFRRLPKRGFNPIKNIEIGKINLEVIQKLIDNNKIKTDNTINLEVLKKAKVFSNSIKKFKILGSGEIKSKINISATYISNTAKLKIEKIGGKLTLNK